MTTTYNRPGLVPRMVPMTVAMVNGAEFMFMVMAYKAQTNPSPTDAEMIQGAAQFELLLRLIAMPYSKHTH